MTKFRSLRGFCLGLFGVRNLSGVDIVDIWVEDAASVCPDGSEGVRVAFTLTYSGMNKLDGPTHSALECLLGAGGDDPQRIDLDKVPTRGR